MSVTVTVVRNVCGLSKHSPGGKSGTKQRVGGGHDLLHPSKDAVEISLVSPRSDAMAPRGS